jgi:hypothetical protein
MAGNDSPLFYPSSPLTNEPPTLDEQVQGLLEINALHHSNSELTKDTLQSLAAALSSALNRQVKLIKSRSQFLEDNQITLYDLALLKMTRDGSDPQDPTAITFYLREYLNISTKQATLDIDRTLRETVELPNRLNQGIQDPSPSRHPSGPSTYLTYRSSSALSSNQTTLVDDNTITFPEQFKVPSQLAPLDPRLHRSMCPKLSSMWSTYTSSRTEYISLLGTGRHEQTIKAAKFLRDTAENILLYIRHNHAPSDLGSGGAGPDGDAVVECVKELQGTFDHAKNTVVCLTGGKKRKFDHVGMSKAQNVPRGPKAKRSSARAGRAEMNKGKSGVSERGDVEGKESSQATSSTIWFGEIQND